MKIKEYFLLHYILDDKNKFHYNLGTEVRDIPLEEAKHVVEKRIVDHIQRLEYKKPAILLSGGIDSSAVAYYTSLMPVKPDAFTIGFSEKSDEFEKGRRVADYLGLKHYSIMLKEPKPEEIDEVMRALPLPCAETGSIPLYLVAKAIKEKGYDIIFSGDGGDEVFLGYKWHKLELLPLPYIVKQKLYNYMFTNNVIPDGYVEYGEMLRFEVNGHLLHNHIFVSQSIGKALGIQLYSPLCESDVVEFVYHLPLKYKISLKRDKILLRELMKNRLPFPEASKFYFHNPVGKWIGVKGSNREKAFLTRLWFLERWLTVREPKEILTTSEIKK